jgi:hypothetical protein
MSSTNPGVFSVDAIVGANCARRSGPYLAVAEEMGYFRDEGLKLTILSLNGASASFKAMATGQADYAFSGPAQVLNGLAAGEATKSFYTAYQGHVYRSPRPTTARIAGLPISRGRRSVSRPWQADSIRICSRR